MPEYPRLSQLPTFIPASEAATRVLEIFTDSAANEAFVRELARLATTQQHTPAAANVLAEAAASHA